MKKFKDIVAEVKAGDFGLKGTMQKDKVKMMRQYQAAQNRIKKAYKSKTAPSAKDMAFIHGGTEEQWQRTLDKKYKK